MKIKKLKIKLNKDNEYSDYRYFIPKSNNIKMTDGRDVDEAVQSLKDKIANLKEQANYLINKAPLVKYAEGTSITITDCAEAPLRKFSIEGDSYQETREGYNLLPNNAKNMTANGLTFTVNEDKSITINGTATDVTDLYLFGTYGVMDDTFLVNGTITIGLITMNEKVHLTLIKDGTTEIGTAKSSLTLNLGEDTNINCVILRVLNGATISNQTFYPMIVQGDVLGEYEAFGVSPSPNYPSKVESVGDNINLFDKDNAKILNAFFHADNTVIVANNNRKLIYIECEPNQKYTISTVEEMVVNKMAVGYTNSMPAVGVQVYSINAIANKQLTIITGADAKYLVAYIYSEKYTKSFEEIINNLKIVKGTRVGSYSSYGNGSVEIKKANDNFIDDANIRGKEITTTGNRKIPTPILTEGEYYFNVFVDNTQYLINNHISLNLFDKSNQIVLAQPILNEKFSLSKEQISAINTAHIYFNSNFIVGNSGKVVTGISLSKQKITTYTPHKKEETYNLEIQEEMLEGDKLEYTTRSGVADWFEKHNYNKIILDGTTEGTWVKNDAHANTFILTPASGIINAYADDNNIPICTHFEGNKYYAADLDTEDNIIMLGGANNINRFLIKSTDFETADELKVFLAENNVIVYYKSANTRYIQCTDTQKAVLNKICRHREENEMPDKDDMKTYKGTTHITTDSEVANIKLIYKQDINAILEGEGV